MTANKNNLCIIRTGSIETVMGIFRIFFESIANTFDHVYFMDANKVFTSKINPDGKNSSVQYHCLPKTFDVISPVSLGECRKFLKSSNITVINSKSLLWKMWKRVKLSQMDLAKKRGAARGSYIRQQNNIYIYRPHEKRYR